MVEDFAYKRDRFPAVPGPRPYRPADGTTIPANQHGRRQTPYGEPAGNFLVFVKQDRQIDAEVAEELLDALRIEVRRHRHNSDLFSIEV